MTNSQQPFFGGEGYLIVRVSTANGFIPVQNAKVTVEGSDTQTAEYKNEMMTNISGVTDKLTLATPNASTSLSPEQRVPYAKYRVTVEMENFLTHVEENVQVFEKITSIQPISLIPTSRYRAEENVPNLPQFGSNT